MLLFLLLLYVGFAFACQKGCQCPTRTTALCQYANLRSIPVLLDPRTTRLDLSNNRIARISADELSVYPNLEYLSLANNSLMHLNVDVFTALPQLRTLDLSSNELMTLPNGVFATLKNLKTLILSNNEVSLAGETLSGLHSLTTLSLNANKLSYLPPSVFGHLKNLQVLDLSDNKLLELPASLLSTLPKLRILDVKRNLLSKLDEGMFATQRHLDTLDLSENLISDIGDGALFGMDNLTSLNLSGNQLVRLPGNTWPLPKLRSLDISSNLFVALETASFDTLSSLQYLNISRSRNLRSIHMASFVSLTSLHWLSLANSNLQTISQSAFTPSPPLTFLDLSHNRLTGLAANLLDIPKITVLRLEGNPWECDCELRALTLKSAQEALCAGPENLRGVALNELKECTILQGMLVPLILGIVLLLLAVVVLILALKRPSTRKSSIYQHPSLIHVLSQKDCGFDRSVYSPSDDSHDSAYESPNSAFLPKSLPPMAPTCGGSYHHDSYRSPMPHHPSPQNYNGTYSGYLPPSNRAPPPPRSGTMSSSLSSSDRESYRILTQYPVPITQL